MEKSRITIHISQDDVDNALLNMLSLDLKNRKDISKLLSAMIYDNTRGAEWFMKMAVGGRYPTLPKVGDTGWIRMSDHTYTYPKEKKEEMEQSQYNQHGYFPCTICAVGSIHSYGPLTIQLPNPAGEGLWSLSIDIDKFYPGESIDIYEDLPI